MNAPRALLWPLVWAWHWLLRYQLWETENWLRECESDGLLIGPGLDNARAQRDDFRVRVIRAQAWLYPLNAAPVGARKG